MELLVVIGIVSVLIGILLPAVNGVRRRSGEIRCAANLKQWATAANLYALAWHNYLPRRGQGQQQTALITRPSDWFNALPVILREPAYQDLVAAGKTPTLDTGGLWICPQATSLPNASGYLFTYGMNMRLSTWLTTLPDRIDHLGDLSTMVFMADAASGYCSVLPFGQPFSPIARHDGRVNIAFLDGHVTSYTAAYVGCNVGDPDRPDVRWKVPGSPWTGPTE